MLTVCYTVVYEHFCIVLKSVGCVLCTFYVTAGRSLLSRKQQHKYKYQSSNWVEIVRLEAFSISFLRILRKIIHFSWRLTGRGKKMRTIFSQGPNKCRSYVAQYRTTLLKNVTFSTFPFAVLGNKNRLIYVLRRSRRGTYTVPYTCESGVHNTHVGLCVLCVYTIMLNDTFMRAQICSL